ncbi:smoothelin-like protein 1 [Hyla sarda]|uniref:smoothelin-like protein 1 n=1 Tax=Hyla sarda TaxID=327740 RepID=UPI0024C2F90B|nr:smoothelin-like protein 1 [Hyla sarda]
MEEEQLPVLTEQEQGEASSLQFSEIAKESTINGKEEGIQECYTTPDETALLENKAKEDVQDNVLDEVHQRDEQMVETKEEAAGKEVIEKGERGDSLPSSGDITEDSVTLDGEKVGTEANEESSLTQEESDVLSHKIEKSEAAATSQEVPTAIDVEDKSKEEQTQASAKDNADKVDNSKSTVSSAKNGINTTPDKDTARGKEHQDRKSELPRSRTMPKSYGRATRKDIAEKFGGVATSGVRVQRSTSCGAGAVKNMLLEWCRAKTRGREGVDIQNFSSSWSSGLAFCALILAFFPDAFDYESLDPKNRRENFQLAFNAAEKFADCPPLLDVEDMVRMKVPDSKCVYTYVQELYRSLVAKGLVKTKKT